MNESTGLQACFLFCLLSCSSLDSAEDSAQSYFSSASGGSGGVPGDSAGGNELPAEWACLGTPSVFVDRAPDRVRYTVAIVDFDSQPPPNTPTQVDDISITVCGSPSCTPPYGEPDVVIRNPLPGLPPFVYQIEVPFNFSNGYLRLTAPGYAPMDYVFGGPMKGAPGGGYDVSGLTIPLLKTSTRDTIYNDLGLPGVADPTRGVLAVRTLDCLRNSQGQSERAPGVRLHAIPAAPPPPAVAWTLSFSNRATPNKLETDMRGVAGFVNVLPGAIDVEGVAPVGAQGTPYGETTVAVRAGVITLAELRDGLDRWGQ